MQELDRRRVLRIAAAGVTAALAGCGDPPESEEGTNPLEVETEADEGAGTDEGTEGGEETATATDAADETGTFTDG